MSAPQILTDLFGTGTRLLGSIMPFGREAGTVCEGNDPRVTGAAPASRRIVAGAGLSGGGSLAGDVRLALEMGYDPTRDYASPIAVIGSDGALYLWRAASGPGVRDAGGLTVGAKDPTAAENEAYWVAAIPPAPPAPSVYAIGEFKDWFEQTPPPGWAVRNGAVLEYADTAYPDLWACLQLPENAWKCRTPDEWTALSSSAGGVGGVPFFVLDAEAKTIKLPDTRGDYTRDAGSSYLQAVGGWHDSNSHVVIPTRYSGNSGLPGAHTFSDPGTVTRGTTYSPSYLSSLTLGASETHPRGYGMLGCVYVCRM